MQQTRYADLVLGNLILGEESSFNLTVVESGVSQTAFTLRWPALNTSDIDHRKFLGYDVSYVFGRLRQLACLS